MSEAIPTISHAFMAWTETILPFFLNCMYIHKQMFHSVGIAHILCFCN